jgi:hypothetical protein
MKNNKWEASELWEKQLYWMLNYALMPYVTLTQAELDALPEYSHSVPTGVFPGKRWKRNERAYPRGRAGEPPAWLLQEYAAHTETTCRLVTSRVDVVG